MRPIECRQPFEAGERLPTCARRAWQSPSRGRRSSRSRGMPAGLARADCRRNSSTISPRHVVVDRLAIHRRERPRLCISTMAAPAAATTCPSSLVVLQAADVVDDRRAPGDGLARDGRLVGVDRHRHAGVRASAFDDRQHATQAPRPAEPVRRPGRVDSPPTSRMSAPSRDHRQAVRHRARRRRSARPPSAKESGVTLMIPMMSVRSPSWSDAPTRQRYAIVLAGTHINDEGHENLVAFELTTLTDDCRLRLKTVD